MTDPVPTNIRSPRGSALLMALQPAQGTLATSFGSGIRFWTNEDNLPLSQPIQQEPRGAMTQDRGDDVSIQHDLPDGEPGRIVVKATAESVEFILRSLWGQFSGGVFTLNTQQKEFFTLAYVESPVLSDAQNLVRWGDVMFHRIIIRAQDLAEVLIEAEFIHSGRTVGTNGDVTLPLGMNFDSALPADQNVFTHRDSEFFRGAVELREASMLMELSINGINRDSQSGGVRPRKLGPAMASLEVTAQVSDEIWDVLKNADAGTEEDFRFRTKAPSPLKTWTMDLKKTRFSFNPLSCVDLGAVDFVGRARAVVGSSSEFVNFALS